MPLPIRTATNQAMADFIGLFYNAASPYGKGWRPCDVLNGQLAGTPTAALVNGTIGSNLLSVLTGTLYAGQPVSGTGIPTGTTIATTTYAGGNAQMSTAATATISNLAIPLLRPRDGNLWMTCLAVNADYWLWKGLGDMAAKQRVVDMANYLFSAGGYTQTEMNSDGATDGSISLLDDAALKARTLEQIYEISGDARFFNALTRMIPAVLRRFRGTNSITSTIFITKDDGTIATDPDGGQFYYWPHGASYGDSGSLADENNPYEATLALSALSIYDRFGGSDAYYHYAYATYFRMKTDYTPKVNKPAGNGSGSEPAYGCGLYYANYSFSLGTCSAWYFGWPKPGASSLDGNLCLAMSMLARRLYNLPRTTSADKATFLSDINNMVISLQRVQSQYGFITGTDADGTQGGVLPLQGILLPWTDAWTDLGGLAGYAQDVLSMSGVDTNQALSKIVAKTGAAALATRSAAAKPGRPAGTYTSDWAGRLQDANGSPAPITYGLLADYSCYEDRYQAAPGSDFNSIAGSPQIMTNAMAVTVGIAASIIEARGVPLPANYPDIYAIYPTGKTLIDPSTGKTVIDDTSGSTLIDG